MENLKLKKRKKKLRATDEFQRLQTNVLSCATSVAVGGKAVDEYSGGSLCEEAADDPGEFAVDNSSCSDEISSDGVDVSRSEEEFSDVRSLDDNSLYEDAIDVVLEPNGSKGEASGEIVVEKSIQEVLSRHEEVDIHNDYVYTDKEFLNRIGLCKYFEEGISLAIMRKESSNKLEELTDIPWYFLSKMQMLDYKGRNDMVFHPIKNSLETCTRDDINSESGSELEKLLSLSDTSQNSLSLLPHPMDVVIAVFKCCSNVVRQILCEKMFLCKLAVPLVLPPLAHTKSLFLLWASRTIAIETRQALGKLCEVPVVSHTSPIISCLRLGNISCSKSVFLNEIVNGQSHGTFFHKNCTNGMNNRYITDGLLEIAWRLPLQDCKSSDYIDNPIAFVNMRGDGKMHEASLKFACEISNVVLVFLDLMELNNPSIYSQLRLITLYDTELVLLITKQAHVKFDKKSKENIVTCIEEIKGQHFSDKNLIFCFGVKGEKNIKVLKDQTLEKISNCLKVNPPKYSLDNFKGLADSLHIRLDEATYDCDSSKIEARMLVKELCKDGIPNVKRMKLPLQGESWHEWAKLDKEQHRREKKFSDSLIYYIDKIHTEKENQRKNQLHYIENSSILFDTFLDFLVNFRDEKLYFCLMWLKHYMDNKSKEILPGLRDACSLKWNEIRQCNDKEKLSNLEEQLARMEIELAESSVGLEHLMREISQAYEAYDYMKDRVVLTEKVADKVSQLPKIMAELMLLGYPLELMDGDAAAVPLTWIKAVLEQLRELVGNKKIFVLSVLGIQSSGKSTLLNTMFGLQFEVAAGRCTRGVHAQLMPISKEYQSEKYDYILVVDTEGLRANELAKAKVQHDNEIATLVIGLGDVTVVNIKGENLSEMEDLLQIVIHALLKMKLVNKSLDLQPSCFFIHQNVPAVDASTKLRTGHQIFLETLDKVTKAAAKEEDAPQFTKFKEVIDFDINTNISYISDLWEGDPPMGPVNPGYSKHVNKVKHILLSNIMPKRASQLTIEKFSKKISDLWDGILDQNFIFSFKNSLEMDAYAALENELSEVLWSLKSAALEWQNTKINYIENSDCKINDITLKEECCVFLEEKCRCAREQIKLFFESNEDNTMLEQWRVKTFQKLNNRYEEIFDRTVSAVGFELRIREIKSDQKRDMHKYKDDILLEAKKVAEGLKTNLKEDELIESFNQKWKVWMSRLPQSYKPDDIDIEDKVYSTLIQKFKADQALVNNAWNKQNDPIISVDALCKNIKYALESYVVKEKEVYDLMSRITNTKSRDDILTNYSLNIAYTLKRFVDEKSLDIKSDTAKQNSVGFELLKILLKFIEETKKSKLKFTNDKELKVYVAIYGFQYVCSHYFKDMKKIFVNDGISQMTEFGIHPIFENVLYRRFSSHGMSTFYQLQRHHKLQKQSLERFEIDVNKHIIYNFNNIASDEALRYAKLLMITLYANVKAYIEKREIQVFREEYVEELIKLVEDMVRNCISIQFSKAFKIEMAVHVCYFAIPKLHEKHKRYKNNVNPSIVFKRDYYNTYFELFKNCYHRLTNEEALAKVLTQHLSKAVENTVDKDMARELVDDIRNNVEQVKLKTALIDSVLRKLLEKDNFEDFRLYLEDTNACFQKWISFFVDEYLFSNRDDGSNRYIQIASRKIKSLLAYVCEKMIESIKEVPEELSCNEALNHWLKEFHVSVLSKLPVPYEDLLSLLEGYDIVSIQSFTNHLKDKLKDSLKDIQKCFEAHTQSHLETVHEDTVYKLVAQECKGCMEKCPFCFAPCSLNTEGHVEQNVKHIVKEHYSQGCGGWRWSDSQKLVAENCSSLVASSSAFKCQKTNWKSVKYSNYHTIYPDWKIHGDPSIEASPYWKWFIVKYEQQLVEYYKANAPDIPDSWKSITKEAVFEYMNN